MLNNEELMQVKGGANASLVTAIVSIFTKLYSLGQAMGSAIRRSYDKNYC